MNVLVLGGTQFVGRALAKGLIARGHEVSILTRGLRPVEYEGIRWHYRADRKDTASLHPLSEERFDVVFDVSAYGAEDVRPVLGALQLDEDLRYVLVSSAAVYLPSEESLAEDAPKGESAVWGAYGKGKLEVENLLVEAQAHQGFALSIVRPAYIYGPGNNLYREAYLFDRLEKCEVIPVPEGGACAQFVFIEDVANQLIGLAGRSGGGVEAFNCAYPNSVDWETLVQTAATAVGVEPHIKVVAHRGRLEARSFFPFRDCTYLLDVSKAGTCGLEANTNMSEGMRATYNWYCQTHSVLSDPKMTKIEEALRL